MKDASDEGRVLGSAVVEVRPDTRPVEAAVRVMAKHLNAMADELEALRRDT